MARFRTLDPAMRDSPLLDDLSLLALLLIDRLIQEADDEGRQYGDPRSIWRAAFPRDNAPVGVDKESVVAALDELVRRRLVVKYEVEGQTYIALPGWRDGRSWQYQNVSRAKPSRFPSPPKGTCPVVARGHGAPPADRSEPAVSDGPATSHGDVAGDVDVDRTGRGREADADADRTGKRASPSPSPAGAGSGEARSGEVEAPTPNSAERRGVASVKAVLDGMSVKKVPRLSGSELADRLRAERVHHGGDLHAKAIDDALAMRAARDPDFDRVGHAVLMKAQVARMETEAPVASGGAS